MTALLLLAAAWPGLYWGQGVETAAAVKRAGVERLYVPAAGVAAWRSVGLDAVPLDEAALAALVKVPAPRVQWKMNVASATRIPWIDANGWRYERKRDAKYFCETPPGAAPLAAAEAFAYDADLVLKIVPADLKPFGRLLAELKKHAAPPLPTLANIGILDDGSALTGEVMNLLARRNLLFRVVSAPDPSLDLNIRIGSPEFPKEAARNPAAFAAKVRTQLTDEKRLLRVYGSDVVIGRLSGNQRRACLHLLNYGGRKIDGLRVRLLGAFAQPAGVADFVRADGATEFTIPDMDVYKLVELERAR